MIFKYVNITEIIKLVYLKFKSKINAVAKKLHCIW